MMTADMLLDWTRVDEISFDNVEDDPAVDGLFDAVPWVVDRVDFAPVVDASEEGCDASSEPVAIPAIVRSPKKTSVLRSKKGVSKRRRIGVAKKSQPKAAIVIVLPSKEGGLQHKQAEFSTQKSKWAEAELPSKRNKRESEILRDDRNQLVAGLMQWFGDHGYALESHEGPRDDVEQLGYFCASFLGSSDARVVIFKRSFPKPVCDFTVRIFDRAGRFPVVFVSSPDGIVFRLQVRSVEHLEENARRFLPQFDVDTEEVSTLFETKRLEWDAGEEVALFGA